MTRAAFVVNPTKFDDPATFDKPGLHDLRSLRKTVTDAMADAGWQPPLWLETTLEDPGREMTAHAVARGVDLVLACGGDGTITACAAALANTGVPLAVVPVGTGNLLARNLELPIDIGAALEIALTGTDRVLDLGVVDGESFVVMAGMGIDAVMLSDASEALKAKAGWLAYAVAAARHLRDRPVRVELSADGARPIRRRIHGLVVGNVGRLQGGIPLLPDAQPDDGFLDVVVLAPRGYGGWLRLAAAVLSRRRQSSQLDHLRVKKVTVRAERVMPCERDGELAKSCQELTVEVMPGALIVRCVPAAEPSAEPATVSHSASGRRSVVSDHQ